VNLVGRESEGSVSESDFDSVIEEARSALRNLASPEDGEPVFEKVMRREQAFRGQWSSRLPDLVMVPRRDEYVYNERPSYGDVIVPADSTTGTHSRDGIFIAWGRGIRGGASLTAQPNLRDIGPTALASLRSPLTSDMDGRALMEVFGEADEAERKGSSYREISSDSQNVYNAAEESELRERLRALGYIE
jgi:predicted AlkP superfamily phosphohydrolase/phosphomutase